MNLLEKILHKAIDRRTFLKATSLYAMMSLGATILHPPAILAQKRSLIPYFSTYPFSVGVASGDPLPDGIIIWTRLIMDRESMERLRSHPLDVHWEVAEDKRFKRIVHAGTTVARPDLHYAVHVDVRGLKANREYYYRFLAGNEQSPIGRTKTAPAAEEMPSALSFAFASCQNYEHGYYTAFDHMAREELDFVLHLGDYIYEYGANQLVAPREGKARKHSGGKCKTLSDYRKRYTQYRQDPYLQKAHALFPWIVVWDDHEVENNYASDIPQRGSRRSFLLKRKAAYQAYYENMPIRLFSEPQGDTMRIYRSFTYGRLAQFYLLDTRQYRDDQKPGDGWRSLDSIPQDGRTLLGNEQERWLFKELKSSSAQWNVLAQQVFFSQYIRLKQGKRRVNTDSWDGYPDARKRLIEYMSNEKVNNPVVLTGDVHSNWVSDIKEDFKDANAAIIATEFVGTSITSEGDGSETLSQVEKIKKENPHLLYCNNQRGYVRCQLTEQSWQTDFRIVPYVSKPYAPIHTHARYIINAGKAGAKRQK
ncbi:alkaline phosphatase [Mechercharimyces sp. CAU 1602]|uniref:alkaline phosphatase D family protein n=1 Tax=Mechercharimyces sp. CAU 1602 TaxID=2973933 RepID=UPI002163A4A1|nr:alkaline phosphatase D family protein [Mechercharimyces sp. CAU 1602]MCS1351050.1 alkaline phosphatase D family protein [Mechercharimyces sp. CAU 1602]